VIVGADAPVLPLGIRDMFTSQGTSLS